MRHHLRLIAMAAIGTLIVQGAHGYVAEAALPHTGIVLDTATTSSFKEAFRNSFPVAENVRPYKKDPRRLGIELTAPSAVVVDVETGRVLFSKNVGEKRPLASLTKLMTALVMMDLKLDPKQEITMSEADIQSEGKAYFAPGDTFLRGELMQVTLGVSSNNGIAALVRTSGLSREAFVARMNAKAKAIGIDASFVEPTGLNSGNQSTALGVQKMLRAAMQYPEIRKATTTATFRITSKEGKAYKEEATDELLGTILDRAPYEIIGGKTGYIEEAGFCLAQTVERGGHQIDIVVLGATAHELRFQEVKSLAVWTFDAFNWDL
jgi:D-alanyl-D-alanine carboxypeptidase